MAERIPSKAAPLADLTFALAGPGRVGKSLASWAVARGARLEAVAGRRDLESLDSSGSDLLLVAVPDGALAEVAETLARRPQAPVALHTSGALGASVLAPLEVAGAATGSFHPLKAFPRPLPDPAAAAGTFFALDGAPRARELGERLAAAFGGVAGVVPEEARDLYHLAASTAAGGVATLVASAGELARELGLPPAVAGGYLELARGALSEMARAAGEAGGGEEAPHLERAITGPLARGDVGTFLRELGTLAAAGPPARRLPLLARLALETVRLTAGPGEAARLAETLSRRGFLDPPGDGC